MIGAGAPSMCYVAMRSVGGVTFPAQSGVKRVNPMTAIAVMAAVCTVALRYGLLTLYPACGYLGAYPTQAPTQALAPPKAQKISTTIATQVADLRDRLGEKIVTFSLAWYRVEAQSRLTAAAQQEISSTLVQKSLYPQLSLGEKHENGTRHRR